MKRLYKKPWCEVLAAEDMAFFCASLVGGDTDDLVYEEW